MTAFVVGALALILIAVVFIVWPFRRRRAGADFSQQQLNAAIYRDQMAEIERDRAIGALDQADFEQARAELQRRLIEDSPEQVAVGAAPERAGFALPIALGAFLPLAAILLYLALGNPTALNPPPRPASPHGDQFTQQDIDRMVAGLAAKLESEPENYRGWAMLARSYKQMGRYPEAARAYARTGPMLETSADLLVDYADALAVVENGFTPAVVVLIDRALKLDPAQPQGLWLRGTAAFEAKRYDQAIADWQALLKLFPAGSEEASVIAANIAEARALAAGKRP